MSTGPKIFMSWVEGPRDDYTYVSVWRGGAGQCFQNPKSFSGIPL